MTFLETESSFLYIDHHAICIVSEHIVYHLFALDYIKFTILVFSLSRVVQTDKYLYIS